MGEVKALPGHPIAVPDGVTNSDIIGPLEDLLAKARAGQVRAIAWCTYNSTDMVTFGWQAEAYGFHLAAAIMTLHSSYSKELAKIGDN